MGHEAIELYEGPVVQQEVKPFSGGELPTSVLSLEAFSTTSFLRFSAEFFEPPQFLVYGHRGYRISRGTRTLWSILTSSVNRTSRPSTIVNAPVAPSIWDNACIDA